MVRAVGSLGRSGLQDWVIQRISAVILTGYTIFLLGYLFCHPDLDYVTWVALFQCQSVKWFSLFAVLALIMHAWIGLWTVITDYIKCAILRLCMQSAVIGVCLVLFLWAIDGLWSV